MAISGANKDFKSGPGSLDRQAQPVVAAKAVGGSAGQLAIAASASAAEITKTPKRDPHPSSLKLSKFLDPLLPHLDSKSLACFLRVCIATQPRTQKELDKRNQRDAKKVIDLTLRGGVSDLHLMSSPAPNTPCQASDERHLYLYQEQNGLVFYYYVVSQTENQKEKYYLLDEKQPPVDFKSHSFNSTPANLTYCVDEALRKSVFDMTSKRKHTLRSDSEEIRRMVDENQGLPFVVYQPKPEEATTVRNNGGQLINLVGKTPLQVARGENHDYAINAMTRKLLDVKDEKQKQANGQKIQAQYAAQDATGTAEEERVKANNRETVVKAQKALEKAVLESKPGDIQDAGHPTYKLTLAKTAGGAAIAAAVTQLEALLEAVRNTMVRIGCHDNPELQLQAREEYNRLLDAGHDWQGAKMQFLFRNLGRYQQMMSLGYTHGFCGDGLYENVDKLQKGQTPRESTSVVVWDSARGAWSGQVGLYSCRGSLGVDFAIGGGGGGRRGVAGTTAVVVAGGRPLGVSNLMSIKNSRHTDPSRSNSETIGLIRQNRPA
jgi:hypothetical protein